jgi:hypothetical protein
MPRHFQEKLLNFMESGHVKVDQMRKQYDFTIRGAKVFAGSEIPISISTLPPYDYIVDYHMIEAKQGEVAWFLSKEGTVRFVDLIPDFTHYYCPSFLLS